MEEKLRKRVARIGKQFSNKKCDSMEEVSDVVMGIMKEMDDNISSAGNEKLFTCIGLSCNEIDVTEKNSSYGNKNNKSRSGNMPHIKKYLPPKRNPLMEKCQKNFKYIKHNRKIDKPRAHVGRLHESPRTKVLKMHTRGKKHCKPKNVERKTLVSDTDEGGSSHMSRLSELSDESSNSKDTTYEELPNISSNSDSEFESFVRSQKNTVTTNRKVNSAKKRKKHRESQSQGVDKQKPRNSKKCKKIILIDDSEARDKTLISESNIYCDETVHQNHRTVLACNEETSADKTDKSKHKKRKKHKDGDMVEIEYRNWTTKKTPKKFEKVRLTTSQSKEEKFSEISISCAEPVHNNHENNLNASEETKLKDEASVVLNNHALYNMKCAVRLERNPDIEEALSGLLKPSVDGDNINRELEDSGDDCIIVTEVPKDHSFIDGMQNNDIQISDVMSLRDCLNVSASDESTQPMDAVQKSNNQVSSDPNELINRIDFNRLKEVVKTCLSPNKEVLPCNEIGSAHGNVNTTVNEWEIGLSMPLNIQETFNKLDWGEILRIAKSQSKPNYVENMPAPRSESMYMPSSSRTSDGLNTTNDGLQETAISNQINDSVWQNISDALNQINDLQNNSADYTKNKLSENLGQSSVNKNTCEANGENDNVNIRTLYKNNELSESPSSELDAVAMANIKDLQTSNVNYLFKLCETFRYYQCTGSNVSDGMNVLLKEKADDLQNLEFALQHFVKQDPCFYRTASECRVKKNEKEIAHSHHQVPVKNEINAISAKCQKCNNCGRIAAIKCVGCSKVFFCNRECGIAFWKDGHYTQCQGKPV